MDLSLVAFGLWFCLKVKIRYPFLSRRNGTGLSGKQITRKQAIWGRFYFVLFFDVVVFLGLFVLLLFFLSVVMWKPDLERERERGGEREREREREREKERERYARYLTRPRRLHRFQNRMDLCLKVNKGQRKCHVNCVSGIPEGKVTMRCVGDRKN